MDAWTLPLELITVTGEVQLATVALEHRYWTEGEVCKTQAQVTLRWSDGEVSGVDWHFFEALCRVRESLAAYRLTPRCYGACRNLIVSGMAADMGRGLKGYLVRLGEPAKLSDLVRIFESGPAMDLVTVAEQREFKRTWLRGFGIVV